MKNYIIVTVLFISFLINWPFFQNSATALEDPVNKITRLEKLIKEDPNNIQAYEELGGAYSELKRDLEAINAYKKAVELNPKNSDNYHHLSLLHSIIKDYPEAIRYEKETLRLAPYNSQAHMFLGFLYNKTNEFSKAITSLQEAIKLNPHEVETHYQLGDAYTGLNDRNKAMAAYKQAIEVQPDHINSIYRIGFLYHFKKSYAEAIALFEKAAEIEPNDWEPFHYLGMVYGASLNFPKAIESFKISIEKGSPDSKTFSLLGLLYQEIKNFKDAIGPLKKALELNPDDAETTWNLAESYARTRDLQTAYKYGKQAKRIFQKQGNDTKVKKLTNYLALIQEELEAQGNQVIKTDEEPEKSVKNEDYYLKLAKEFNQKNNYQKAIANFRQALEINPKLANTYYELASIYFLQNDLENAAQTYKSAIKAFPNDGGLYANLGFIYEKAGRLEKALEQFQKAEDLFEIQNNKEGLKQIAGELQLLREKAANLDDEFNKTPNSPTSNQKNANAKNATTTYEIIQKEWKELPTDEAKLLSLANSNPTPAVYLKLGLAFLLTKGESETKRAFKMAIDLEPNNPEIPYYAGSLFDDLDMYPQAIFYLEKALSKNPKHSFSLALIGELYNKQKKYDQAIYYYERLIDIFPKHIASLKNLGLLYQEVKDDQKAVEVFKRILSLNDQLKKIEYIYIYMAISYQNLDMLQDSITAMKSALRIKPNNWSFHNYLGKLYALAFELKNALKHTLRAKELLPENEAPNNLSKIDNQIKQIEEKLESQNSQS